MSTKRFESLSVNEIDRKLEEDCKEHKKTVIIRTIIILSVLAIIFRGTVSFWLKFGFVFPSGHDKKPINTMEEPVQIEYTEEQKKEKEFVFRSLVNNNTIKIMPQAYYKISGLVVAINHDFVFRSKFFDSAALYDIGIAWGKISNKKIFKKTYKCYSQKNEVSGSRVLWCSYKKYSPENQYDFTYSHSHLVPANNRVMGGLLRTRLWQKIEIEGELIDMLYIPKPGEVNYPTWRYKTSMSRTDSGWSGDRGNGSCETVYVKRVKVGNVVYE